MTHPHANSRDLVLLVDNVLFTIPSKKMFCLVILGAMLFLALIMGVFLYQHEMESRRRHGGSVQDASASTAFNLLFC